MRHIVLIKSRKPDKFNYCKFGSYKNKEGRLLELVDINDHPLIKGKFTVEDVSAKEQEVAEQSIKSAEAITIASKLTEQSMRDLALLMGIDSDQQEMLLRAKIIQFSNQDPTTFLSHLDDIDKEHRIFLKKAIAKEILTKVNGVWKHNTLNIGLTEDQAIVWLKENGDTYALLKHQLRTGKVKQVEKKVKLEKVKEHSMRAGSAISQIEQEIDDIKNNK